MRTLGLVYLLLLWCSQQSFGLAQDQLPRVAVIGFISEGENSALWKQNEQLADLLTVQLATKPELVLVDRESINKVTREISLSLFQSGQQTNTVQVGQLLHADWFLIGSLNKGEATNFVLAKIVDAHTGIIRDLKIFVLEEKNLAATATLLRDFTLQFLKTKSSVKKPTFLTVGGFEDLSLNNRYPDFRKNLKLAIETTFKDEKTATVERVFVDPLLNELRMNLTGVTVGPQTMSIEPAFLLIDGVYQSFQDENSKIQVVLRVKRIGGFQSFFRLKGFPGKDLNGQIVNTIREILEKPNVALPSKKEEAREHFARGIERSHSILGFEGSGSYQPNPFNEEGARNVREALEAFEAALLLDPDYEEAKLNLAKCLLTLKIEKNELARDYLQEIIASSTNSNLVPFVYAMLYRSYYRENIPHAIDLILARERATTNPTERCDLLDALLHCYQSLNQKGKASTDECVAIWKKLVLAKCDKAEWLEKSGGRFDVVDLTKNNFITLGNLLWDAKEASKQIDTFLPEMMQKHPSLAPHFWSAFVSWSTSSFVQATPSATSIQALTNSFLLCAKSPEQVAQIDTFYSATLEWAVIWAMSAKEYALAEEILKMKDRAFEQKAIVNIKPFEHYLAFCYREQKKWKEALALFESLAAPIKSGNGSVQYYRTEMVPAGPWGPPNTEIWYEQEIATCKQALGLPFGPFTIKTNSNYVPPLPPVEFQIGEPVLTVRSPLVFACDGETLWLGEGPVAMLWEKRDEVPDEVDLGGCINSTIQKICVGKEKVWFGTSGSGLIEYDKKTKKVRHYTEENGLQTSKISDLLLQGDRLWIGFRACEEGGLGYLDLKTGKIIGMTPEFALPSDTNTPPALRRLVDESPTAPPRHFVVGLGYGSMEDLWVGVRWKGVQHYSLATKQWTTMSCAQNMQCFVANSEYFACGQIQSYGGGIRSYEMAKGLWYLPHFANFLPTGKNRSANALAIEGQYLWIGGQDYLGVGDMKLRQDKKYCKVNGLARTIEITKDRVWVSVDNKLYCLPRMTP